MSKPLFSWLNQRSAGLFCHITALPSNTGIGNIGAGARQLIDLLSEAGIRHWQFCPLGPTGYGDSPYQSYSAFAGNPLLIDWQPLLDAGWIDDSALETLRQLPHDQTDYPKLQNSFYPLLRTTFQRFDERGENHLSGAAQSFDDFCGAEKSWLDAYCRFMTLKQKHADQPWYEWPARHRSYLKDSQLAASNEETREARFHAFCQYLFFSQFQWLRRYANERSIQLIGDIPIFVALDSADVWAQPDLFQLDKQGRPTHVAGVPPDYFSADGQLWGNPLYNWQKHAEDGFDWWLRRFESNNKLADIVRIDHFRGFESHWSVAATETNARNGSWEAGPGLSFFKTLQSNMPNARLIAEDLGEISPEVRALLAQTGLPGMAVLQFAFDPWDDSLFLPHNHVVNSVVYTGTHDNDTTRGWYEKAPQTVRDFTRRYLGVSGENIAWDFIRSAYRSPARIALAPLQDYLNLNSHARFNSPGSALGNWRWRCQSWQLEQLRRESAQYLNEIAQLYRRLP
jgi:4-alpha-glucanotransferase